MKGSSTASPDHPTTAGISRPAAASPGRPTTAGISRNAAASPGRHATANSRRSRTTTTGRPGTARFTTSNRYIRAAAVSLMFCTMMGVCLRAQGEFSSWNDVHTVQSMLKAIHAQQHRYFRVARAYAGSLEKLDMRLPANVQGRMYAGRMGAGSGFVAELCARNRCWAINQHGEVLERRSGLERQWAGPEDEEPSAGNQAVASLHEHTYEHPRIRHAEPSAAWEHTQQGPAEGGADDTTTQLAVIPQGSPESFGLKAGQQLPPLSTTRDSEALWLPLVEVRR